MADANNPPAGSGEPAGTPPPPAATTPPEKPVRPARSEAVHSVTFVSFPKLLFAWPLLLAGYILWPLGAPPAVPAGAAPATQVAASTAPALPPATSPAAAAGRPVSERLEILGWIYIWVALVVVLALGVDIDRNMAAFWILLAAAVWLLGLWLRDAKHFTFFGDIYRWFADLNVQYNRNVGLAFSIVLSVPYLIMLLWSWLNDRWRITHNEFEHYSFGRMDDSLGRGAKTIRTNIPDLFELLLGLAGTLIVYNASGTRELRRIPHVVMLPLVRRRLNKILERTAITSVGYDEEEEEENQV